MSGVVTSRAVFTGCAGWSIPKEHASLFPPAGSHLERYAQRLAAVEINSSFYRSHQPATYARWANSVPESFRFAVKMPREITHFRRLKGTEKLLECFLAECTALGDKLGPILVQLPPRFAFESSVASTFFSALRERFAENVACEPRHLSWFQADADQLLTEFRIARVAADPSLVPAAALPGGWSGLVYYRWHGSPRMYYSAYSSDALETLAHALALASHSGPAWCIFDNTALGAATTDALTVAQHFNV